MNELRWNRIKSYEWSDINSIMPVLLGAANADIKLNGSVTNPIIKEWLMITYKAISILRLKMKYEINLVK